VPQNLTSFVFIHYNIDTQELYNYKLQITNYNKEPAARDFAGREAAGQKAILCVCRRPSCVLLQQKIRWQREILSQEKQPGGKAYYVYADA
jgi:hypothetical protein